MPPARNPPPPICKTLNINHRNKNITLNENYVEFYFSMGTVPLIFSFFRTDKDLVRAPPPNSGISPPQLLTYFGAYLKNYSHDFHEIFESGSKQY